MALANRNILYVDEINLLDDHVVDVLLDAAAMGINTVEREGVSYSHPARFVLVGTMNPEEGDIRPQLLDRFGLSVVVTGEHDPEQRVGLSSVAWPMSRMQKLLLPNIRRSRRSWQQGLYKLVSFCRR